MLEGIDDIPWKKLKHAHGAASDVPAVLRALAVGSEVERGEALVKVASGLVHQGSVYSATIAAVPFLVEIACAKRVPERVRANIVHCLATCAPSDRAPAKKGSKKAREAPDAEAQRVAYASAFSELTALLPRAKPPMQAALLYFLGEAATRCPKLVSITSQAKPLAKLAKGATDERVRLASSVVLALVNGEDEDALAPHVEALCEAEPSAAELYETIEDDEDGRFAEDAAIAVLEGTSQALVSEADGCE